MRVTLTIEKDDEQPAAFLKQSKALWDAVKDSKAYTTAKTIECHVKIYNQTLRYDHNSDPVENAILLSSNLAKAD